MLWGGRQRAFDSAAVAQERLSDVWCTLLATVGSRAWVWATARGAQIDQPVVRTSPSSPWCMSTGC